MRDGRMPLLSDISWPGAAGGGPAAPNSKQFHIGRASPPPSRAATAGALNAGHGMEWAPGSAMADGRAAMLDGQLGRPQSRQQLSPLERPPSTVRPKRIGYVCSVSPVEIAWEAAV